MTPTTPPTTPPQQTAWRNTFQAGDAITFRGETASFTVVGVAAAGRYLICHQPAVDPERQLWRLVDFDRGARGVDDHYGYQGYDTPEGVAALITALETGQVQLSCRNYVPLDIAIGGRRG